MMIFLKRSPMDKIGLGSNSLYIKVILANFTHTLDQEWDQSQTSFFTQIVFSLLPMWKF